MRNFAGKVLTVEAGAVVQQKGCEAVRLRRSHRSLQPDGVGGHIQGDLVIRLVILYLYLLWNDLPYSEGFMKSGCPEPSERMLKNEIFLLVERRLTQFIRVGPYEILVFLMNFIFSRRNEIILWGKKRTALFQNHNSEKSSFSTRLYM